MNLRIAGDSPSRYAFDAAGVADVTAQFTVMVGNEEILLRQGTNVIGRDPKDTICLNAPEVSRHHARIVVDGGVQRGSILNRNGDTSTPGYGSTPGVRLLTVDQMLIPRIPVVPMSAANA